MTSTRKPHPLDEVTWRDPKTMFSNDYNPNQVFTAEFELLRTSIIEDGWTQPLVVQDCGDGRFEIIDGFHRWSLAMKDETIMAESDGMVPTVTLRANTPKAQRILATVRHNRARGFHGIRRMAEIVRQLGAEGMSDEDICLRMGMEIEEVERLSLVEGTPEVQGTESYGIGWVGGDFAPGEGNTPKVRA